MLPLRNWQVGHKEAHPVFLFLDLELEGLLSPHLQLEVQEQHLLVGLII